MTINITPETINSRESFHRAVRLFTMKISVYWAMMLLTIILLIPSGVVMVLDVYNDTPVLLFLLLSFVPFIVLCVIVIILASMIIKAKKERSAFINTYKSKYFLY